MCDNDLLIFLSKKKGYYNPGRSLQKKVIVHFGNETKYVPV